MRTLRAADLSIAVALVLAATLAVVGAFQVQTEAGARLQSRTFPLLLGAVLLAAGAGLALSAWRSRSREEVEWPDAQGFRRIGVVLASLTVYLIAIEPLGFPISSVFFVWYLVWYFGRYKWYLSGLTGLICGLVLYFVFMKFLGLSLPGGPLLR